MHAGVLKLVADLNGLVRREPALHQRDFDADGFEWLEGNDSANSVIAFLRHSAERAQTLMVITNYTPVVRYDYVLGIPFRAKFTEIMNTDSAYYQGSNVGNPYDVRTNDNPSHGKDQSVALTLPPLATVVFRVERL